MFPQCRSTPVKQQTPLQRTPMLVPRQLPRTPKPSFLQSPANLFSFKKDGGHHSRGERDKDSFLPFLRFYRRPYDEMVYRAKMRPPLGGLTSIVYSQVKTHHQQHSRRFGGHHLQRIWECSLCWGFFFLVVISYIIYTSFSYCPSM
jgi:hypothetical protein